MDSSTVVFTSLLDGAQPRRHRRQAAPVDGDRLYRPRDRQDGEEHGLRVDVLAPEASADSLVDALADYAWAWRGCGRAGEPVVRPSAKAASRRRARGWPRARACPARSSGPSKRQSAPVRRLVAETRLHPAELVLPVFVREGATEPVPISAMPGVVQHSLDSLVAWPTLPSRRASAV